MDVFKQQQTHGATAIEQRQPIVLRIQRVLRQ